MKIKNKVLLLFIAVGLCILAVMGFLLTSQLKQEKLDTISEDFYHQLVHLDFSLNNFILEVETDIRDLANNELVRTPNDREFTSFLEANPETYEYNIGELEQKIINIFSSYRETHPYANSVYMGRENGSFVRSHRRAKATTYDPRERPWYRLAKENPWQVVRTAPYSSVTTKDVNIGVVQALQDKNGRVYGVVGIDVTIANLTDYISNVRLAGDAYFILVDEEGTIIASPHKANHFKNIEIHVGDHYQTIEKNKEGQITLDDESGGKFIVYYTSPNLGWRLMAIIPLQTVNRQAWAFTANILLFFALALFFLSVLTLYGVQFFVVRPLKLLEAGTKAVTRTGNLGESIEVRTKDEIGNLAQSFNTMMSAILTARRELERHQEQLEQLVDERTEELGRSNKRLQAILDNMPATVFVKDLEGRLVLVNRLWEKDSGLDREDAIGKGNTEIFPASVAGVFESDDRAVLFGEKVLTKEETLRTPGGVRSFTTTLVPLRDNENQTIGLCGVSTDITQRKEAEAKLARLERRTRLVLESAGEGIFGLNTRGAISFVNPAAARMLGYAAEDLIGQPIHELVHHSYPDGSPYPDEECHMFAAYTKGKAHQEFDEVLWRRDGTSFPVEYTATPILTDGGIAGAVVTFRDITERKEADEALKASERRLADIIDFLPDPTMVIDHEGRLASWNKAMEDLTGVKADDILGKGDYEYSLPFYQEKRPVLIDLVREWEESYREKYLSVRMVDNHLVSESFHPHMGSNGIYLSATAGELFDQAGRAAGAIETLRDITEQKRAEEEVRTNRRQLRAIIENIRALVVMKDVEGRHLLVNKFFEDATGVSMESALGKTDFEIFPRDVAKQITGVDREALTTGRIQTCEENVPHPDGHMHTYLTTKVPLINEEGEAYALVGLATDVTEMKAIQEALGQARMVADEANQAKSDFLANMSHEIRTPMNAIIGMSHLALQTELTSKQHDYLSKIGASAHALLGIINDILDFSKIEAGKLDMESVDFNLESVLENVSNLVTIKAHEKGLEVLFRTDPEAPPALVGDSLRLGQVLVNLANNAVKFTEKGEIVVSTSLLEKGSARVKLRFSVRDTGIGLTEEQIGRLFQAFSQADTTTTRKYGGTGLGLTISKRLVEMMGGEIWVESEAGKGSEFIFTAGFGLGREKDEDRLVPAADLRGMRVLVIDDNATSRNILQDMLRSMSFDAMVAASGAEGLAELESAETPFELVLMDWKMPGMDGIEASRRIKGNPNLTQIPTIIMVTAYGREEIMRQAEQTGLEGFLIKPVNASVLFNTIMEVFNKETGRRPYLTGKADREADLVRGIRGARVLLVEDNEINQQVAREILEGAGLNVSLAENGREALDRVKGMEFDLVLMDIQMPEMDGFEATAAIRDLAESANDDRYKDLPIIAMTAHAMASDREKSLAAGMNDHVTKPIDTTELFSALVKWIAPRANGAGAEPGPAAAAGEPVDIEIPDLPGFNVRSGISRVGGNKELYRRLLGKFLDDYRHVTRELEDALEAGAWKTAQRLAHTVKGVAGNIAADRLHQAAAELDAGLKKEDAAGLAPLIGRFDEALGEVLEELMGLPAEPVAEAAAPASSEEADPAELMAALDKLAPHVRARKPKLCAPILDEILGVSWPADLAGRVGEMGKLIRKYKFKDAETELTAIREELASKGE